MFWDREAKDSEMDAAVMLKLVEACPSVDPDNKKEVLQMFVYLHREYVNKKNSSEEEFKKDFNEVFCEYLRKHKSVGERFVRHAKIELARTPRIGEILETILEEEGKFSGPSDKKEFHSYVSRCRGTQSMMNARGIPYEPIGIMLMKSERWGITSKHIAKAVLRQDLVGKLDKYLNGSGKRGHKTVKTSQNSDKGWRKYIPQGLGIEQLATGKGLAYAATILIGAYSMFNLVGTSSSAQEKIKVKSYDLNWGTNPAREKAVEEVEGLVQDLRTEISEGDKKGARDYFNNLGVLLFDIQTKDSDFKKEAPKLYAIVSEAQDYYKKAKGEINGL